MTRLAEVKAQFQGERNRADTLATILHLLINRQIDAVETVDDGEDRYTVELLGATRASGGYVVITFYSPVNRHASIIRSELFDTWRAEPRDYIGLSTAFAIAGERLAAIRSNLLKGSEHAR